MRRVIAVLAVLGMLLAGCSSGEEFVLGEDDLCEWVSGEDVAGFVEAEFGWVATADGVTTEDAGCRWKLVDSEGVDGWVWAHEARWVDFDSNPIDLATWEVEDYADLDDTFVPPGSAVVGYPSVGEGMVIVNGGFGQYAFSIPPGDRFLQVEVSVPEEEDWDTFEPKLYSIADSIIESLS